MKRVLEVLTCVVAVTAIIFTIWHTMFEDRTKNVATKEAVTKMHHVIVLSQTKEDVTSVYEKNKTERNTIRTDMFQNTWEIGMPFEFGASDWILYVQFDPENHVSAVAMRSSDGVYRRPPTSPEDKGQFDIPKAPRKK